MRQIERIKMSETMTEILRYLTEEKKVPPEGLYVSYGEIAKRIKKSRHAVAFGIERLRKEGKIQIYDNKLHVVS